MNKTEEQKEKYAKNYIDFIGSLYDTFSTYSDESLKQASDYFKGFISNELNGEKPEAGQNLNTTSGRIAAVIDDIRTAKMNSFNKPKNQITEEDGRRFMSIYNANRVFQIEREGVTLKSDLYNFGVMFGFSNYDSPACVLLNKLIQDCENVEMEAEIYNYQNTLYKDAEDIDALGRKMNELQHKEQNLYEEAKKYGMVGVDIDDRLNQFKDMVNEADANLKALQDQGEPQPSEEFQKKVDEIILLENEQKELEEQLKGVSKQIQNVLPTLDGQNILNMFVENGNTFKQAANGKEYLDLIGKRVEKNNPNKDIQVEKGLNVEQNKKSEQNKEIEKVIL